MWSVRFHPANTYRPNSASVLGNTTDVIAAPAEDVLTLFDGGAVTLADGNSFAAPQVTGTVGLLLALDSTLSPSLIKSYILDGARDTGVSNQPALPVSGTPPGVTVYQLNAYKALRRLARTRPGLSVCGYPVRTGSDSMSIILDAPAPAGRSIPVGRLVRDISVAQGGRRIAVRVRGTTTYDSTVVFNHTGTKIAGHANEWRSYLERDTVSQQHVLHQSGHPLYPTMVLTGPSFPSPQAFNPFAQIAAATQASQVSPWGFAYVSAAADFALLARHNLVLYTDPITGCHAGRDTIQFYLAPVSGIAPALLSTNTADPCDPSAVAGLLADAGWAHDGRTAIFSVAEIVGVSSVQQSVIRRATAAGLLAPLVTIPGRQMVQPTYFPDDSLVQWTEFSIDHNSHPQIALLCTNTSRSAQPAYPLIGAGTPITPTSLCDGSYFFPRQRPNTPPALGSEAYDLFRRVLLVRERRPARAAW